MTVKKALCIILFHLSALLFAQEAYHVEQENEDGLYLISWSAEEDVIQYIVSLQKDDGQPIDIVTKNTWIRYTLEPGNYSFRVTACHPRSETVMPWDSITARVRPRIFGFRPHDIRVAESQVELVVDGKYFSPESELTLVSKNGSSVFPRSFTVEPSGRQARALFNRGDLSKGIHTVHIKNPDGLEDSLGTFTNGIRRGRVLLGYGPLIPLHGFLFQSFDSFIYPLGLEARGSYFFLQKSWGELGAEGVFAWNYLDGEQNSATLKTHVTELQLSLLYRKELGSAIAIKARLGSGLDAFLGLTVDYYYSASPESNSYIYPILVVGASVEWSFSSLFYSELGLDYVLVFMDSPIGYFRPFAGIGIRF